MNFTTALSFLSRDFCKIFLFFITATVTLAALTMSAVGAPKEGAGPMFTKDGELLMPKYFRQWVFVGAPVTPNDMNNGSAAFPEFHDVYIDPISFNAYRKTGKFPDVPFSLRSLHRSAQRAPPAETVISQENSSALQWR